MEHIGTIIDARERAGRRGDVSFVALLFVVAVPLAAATFLLSRAFVGNVDTMRAFVPKSAVVYAHVDGTRGVERLLRESPLMPTGVRPREAAVYAVPGDDGLQWSAILGWSALRPPNRGEREAMRASRLQPIDERHFLVGDASAATASRVASATRTTIADVRSMRARLDAVASRSAVQIFIDAPALAVGADIPELSELLRTGDTLEQTFAGIRVTNEGFMMRTLAPRQDGPLDANALARELTRVDADMAFTEIDAHVDLALPFSVSADRDADPSLVDSRIKDLRKILRGPYAMWVRGDAAAGGAFTLHLPELHTAIASDALARLFSARHPSTVELTLPDGGKAWEYQALPSVPRIDSRGDAAFGGLDGDTIVVGSDGGKGTLISSAPAMLHAYRAGKQRNAVSPCVKNALSLVQIADVDRITLLSTAKSPFLSLSNIGNIQFGIDVDNSLFACGKSE